MWQADKGQSGQSGHDPLKNFEKGAWPSSRDPLNFWALNANSSKTVNVRVSRDSPDTTP